MHLGTLSSCTSVFLNAVSFNLRVKIDPKAGQKFCDSLHFRHRPFFFFLSGTVYLAGVRVLLLCRVLPSGNTWLDVGIGGRITLN